MIEKDSFVDCNNMQYCGKITDVRKVRPGSVPLLEQVSSEVGLGVHMVSIGAVPPASRLPIRRVTPVPSNHLATCVPGFDMA